MGACKKNNGNCNAAVSEVDGLPVQCVGPWALKKHHYVRTYIDATRSVRALYIPPDGAGTVFLDLFAGPGRARIDDNGQQTEGTPLIALNEPTRSFSKIILCDSDQENVDALVKRTASDAHRVHIEHGDCNALIGKIVRLIPPAAFCVALLDPFAPSALAFETIKRLAVFPRMDLIINLPLGPMKRNFRHYRNLERFLGLPVSEWNVDIVRGHDMSQLLPVFRRQLATLGYGDDQIAVKSPRVANRTNTTLYHLVFASKHVKGEQIWNSVTKNEPNGQLSLL